MQVSSLSNSNSLFHTTFISHVWFVLVRPMVNRLNIFLNLLICGFCRAQQNILHMPLLWCYEYIIYFFFRVFAVASKTFRSNTHAHTHAIEREERKIYWKKKNWIESFKNTHDTLLYFHFCCKFCRSVWLGFIVPSTLVPRTHTPTKFISRIKFNS